jgi:hypothetical protein
MRCLHWPFGGYASFFTVLFQGGLLDLAGKEVLRLLQVLDCWQQSCE